MNIIHYLGKGVYHEDNNMPCQDFANHCYASNGNIIMALSDGCSSAKYSQDASRITVETIIDYFEKNEIDTITDDTESKQKLLDYVNNAFEKFNKKNYLSSPSQFSATLLFAVIGKEKVLIGHIGDGNIVCCDKTGKISLYSDEENGAASNQTFFSVDADAVDHFRINIIARTDVSEVIMYSDGPQKMFYYIGNKKTENAAAGLLTEVYNNEITDCKTLSDRLCYLTGDAMYQLMDDWSILIFDEDQTQCDDIYFNPVSMKERFLKGYKNENRS